MHQQRPQRDGVGPDALDVGQEQQHHAREAEQEPDRVARTEALAGQGVDVSRGRFRAMMDVELVNDGPVTLWLETARSSGKEGDD